MNKIKELKKELEILKKVETSFKYGNFLNTISILRECLNDDEIEYFKTLILQDLDADNNLEYSHGYIIMLINDIENIIKNPPSMIL